MGDKQANQVQKAISPPGPVVLAINICDTVIRDEITHKVSLIGLFSTITAAGFPCTHPRMHIYIALTNGHKEQSLEVRLVSASDQKPIMEMVGTILFETPLQVIELNIQWNQVVFPGEGEYFVEVLCDGNAAPIGTRKFNVLSNVRTPPTDGSEA